MAATVISSSAAAAVVFGCTAETGLILNNISRNSTRETVELKDEDGDFIAAAFVSPKATISIEGTVNGTTGVAAAAPGVALSLNSTISGNGITGGSVIVNSVTRTQTAEGFSTISVEATQYPLL